jgi:DUF3102 family protein
MCAGNAARIGKLLAEAKELLPHGEFLPWLEANTPYSRQRCHEFMKLTKCPQLQSFEDSAPIIKLLRAGSHVSHNSGDHEWYTPPECIAAANLVMGDRGRSGIPSILTDASDILAYTRNTLFHSLVLSRIRFSKLSKNSYFFPSATLGMTLPSSSLMIEMYSSSISLRSC